jgi:nicotinate-nucleotide adenylyltransferase
MAKDKKIGLFFGSFNPVHVGHLIIANHILSDTDLDEVWMVVSPHNPLKEKQTLAPDYDRLKMVELAIGDHTRIKASNVEFILPKPSYTIDTLAYLREKNPNKTYVLIMGGDNISTINKWKNYQELIKHYEIYVYERPGFSTKLPEGLNENKIKIVNAPLLDISATMLRERIKEGRSIRYSVTDEVYEYINIHQLYKK